MTTIHHWANLVCRQNHQNLVILDQTNPPSNDHHINDQTPSKMCTHYHNTPSQIRHTDTQNANASQYEGESHDTIISASIVWTRKKARVLCVSGLSTFQAPLPFTPRTDGECKLLRPPAWPFSPNRCSCRVHSNQNSQ